MLTTTIDSCARTAQCCPGYTCYFGRCLVPPCVASGGKSTEQPRSLGVTDIDIAACATGATCCTTGQTCRAGICQAPACRAVGGKLYFHRKRLPFAVTNVLDQWLVPSHRNAAIPLPTNAVPLRTYAPLSPPLKSFVSGHITPSMASSRVTVNLYCDV